MTGSEFSEVFHKSTYQSRFPARYEEWRREFENLLLGRENIDMSGFSALGNFKNRNDLLLFLGSAGEEEIEETLKAVRTDLRTAIASPHGRRGGKLKANPLFWILVGVFAIMLGFGIAAIFIPEEAVSDKLPGWAWNLIKFCFSPVGAGGCILQLALALREWRSDMAEDGWSGSDRERAAERSEDKNRGNYIEISHNKVKIVQKQVNNSTAVVLVAVAAVVAVGLVAAVLIALAL